MKLTYKTKYDLDAIYNYIVTYKTANDGVSPTMREIMKACKVSSTSVVSYLLDMLMWLGRIRIGKRLKRYIIEVL